jgi:hypothetical protein
MFCTVFCICTRSCSLVSVRWRESWILVFSTRIPLYSTQLAVTPGVRPLLMMPLSMTTLAGFSVPEYALADDRDSSTVGYLPVSAHESLFSATATAARDTCTW